MKDTRTPIILVPKADSALALRFPAEDFSANLLDVCTPRTPQIIGTVPNAAQFSAAWPQQPQGLLARLLKAVPANGHVAKSQIIGLTVSPTHADGAYSFALPAALASYVPSLQIITNHFYAAVPRPADYDLHLEVEQGVVLPATIQRAKADILHTDGDGGLLRAPLARLGHLLLARQQTEQIYMVSDALPTEYYTNGYDTLPFQNYAQEIVKQGRNYRGHTIKQDGEKYMQLLQQNMRQNIGGGQMWQPKNYDIIATNTLQPHRAVPNNSSSPIARTFLRAWFTLPALGADSIF